MDGASSLVVAMWRCRIHAPRNNRYHVCRSPHPLRATLARPANAANARTHPATALRRDKSGLSHSQTRPRRFPIGPRHSPTALRRSPVGQLNSPIERLRSSTGKLNASFGLFGPSVSLRQSKNVRSKSAIERCESAIGQLRSAIGQLKSAIVRLESSISGL
jgi:hypothetical protein